MTLRERCREFMDRGMNGATISEFDLEAFVLAERGRAAVESSKKRVLELLRKEWRKMFDPKCLDLADHFLPTDASQRLRYAMAQAVQDAVELFMDDEITALENKLGVCPACHGKKVTYIGGKSPSDAVQFATCGVCRGSGTMVPAQ